MAEVAARPRQGEAADGRGRLSQRLQRRLGDADAELLFARRAHRVAASGDRHPREAAGDGTRRVPEEDAGRPAGNGRACRSSSMPRGIGGTWSNWYDTMFKCGGFNAKDFFCVKELDDQFDQVPGVLRPRPSASSWPSRSSGRSWRILLRPGVPPRLRQRDRRRASRRRSGRTCSRRSPPATAYPWEDIQLSSSGGDGDGSVHLSAHAVCHCHAAHPEPDHLHGGPAHGRPGDADGGARRAGGRSRPGAHRVGARPAVAGAVRGLRARTSSPASSASRSTTRCR